MTDRQHHAQGNERRHDNGGEGAHGWLPIESAPRDSGHVLLFLPDSARAEIVIGYFSDCSLPGDPDPDANWYEVVGDGGWPIDITVTHWMPLPEPPHV